MIALQRPIALAGYATIVVADLIEEFKTNGTAVWDMAWLTAALKALSGNKCAYCELSFENSSVYFECEHFLSKNDYPDEVVTWNNLLPSCKRCNTTKGIHDVIAEPIIDPTQQNPRMHLRLVNYQFTAITPLGEKTIEVLDFNNDVDLMTDRFRIGLQALSRLRDTAELIPPANALIDPAVLRKMRNRYRNVLRSAQRSRQFAATIATVLVQDALINRVKAYLEHTGAWTNELNILETEVRGIALA